MSFTLVCDIPKSGVPRAVGCLRASPFPRRVGRVIPDGPSWKETDLGPLKCNETKRNQTQACRLPSFVISPNLGLFERSVASLSPVYLGGSVSRRSGEASRRETDPEPSERDGPTQNWARTCRLPSFVISPNLGSLGPSVASRLPVCRDGSDVSSRTDLPGKRRTCSLLGETKPNETKHERVVYPRL